MAGPYSQEQTVESQQQTFLKMWGRSKSKPTGEYFTKMGRGDAAEYSDRHYLYSKTSWHCTQESKTSGQTCTHNPRPPDNILVFKDLLTDNVLRIKDRTDNVLWIKYLTDNILVITDMWDSGKLPYFSFWKTNHFHTEQTIQDFYIQLLMLY